MSIVTFDPGNSRKYPNTSIVEELLGGVGRLIFPDGTEQFAENETFPDVVYSIRGTEEELEEFCKNNLLKYQQYNDQNLDAILNGEELPPIEKFWP